QPELPSEILCAGLTAVARLGRGELEGAEDAADRALARMHHVSSPVFSMGDGYASTASVYLALLERIRPWGSRRDALALRARRACAVLRRFAFVFPIGGPAALLCAADAERLIEGRPLAARLLTRARERAEALGMPFEAALAHLGLARLPGVGDEARRAH